MPVSYIVTEISFNIFYVKNIIRKISAVVKEDILEQTMLWGDVSEQRKILF
jgi:hypothetical protein